MVRVQGLGLHLGLVNSPPVVGFRAGAAAL